MYIQFVDRYHFGTGFLAQLAGPDQREVLKYETLDELKSEVLAIVDDEDISRVEYLFAVIAAKEGQSLRIKAVPPAEQTPTENEMHSDCGLTVPCPSVP